MLHPQLIRRAIDGREKEMGVGVTITAANVAPTPRIVEMAGIEPASSSCRLVLLRAQSTQVFLAPGGRVNQPPDGHSQLKCREHPANMSRLPQTLHTTPNAASRVHSRLDGPHKRPSRPVKPQWGSGSKSKVGAVQVGTYKRAHNRLTRDARTSPSTRFTKT